MVTCDFVRNNMCSSQFTTKRCHNKRHYERPPLELVQGALSSCHGSLLTLGEKLFLSSMAYHIERLSHNGALIVWTQLPNAEVVGDNMPEQCSRQV